MFKSLRNTSTLLATFILFLVFQQTGVARQNDNLAIQFAPESSSFYWSSINHDKILMRVLNSKAWRKLAGTDIANRILEELQRNPEFPGLKMPPDWMDNDSALAEFIASPANAATLQQIALELVSTEIFAFGDANWPKSNELSEAISKRWFAMAKEIGPGIAEEIESDDILAYAGIVRELLKNEFADLELPGTVVGGRIKDVEKVKQLVRDLAPVVRKDLLSLPNELKFLAAGYSLIDQDDRTLLTLDIKADDIPWDWLFDQNDEIDIEPEVMEAIKDGLGDRKVVLAVGHIRDHFVVMLGGSTGFVDETGRGANLLDVAEVAPVKEYLEKELISISFVSASMAKNPLVGLYLDGFKYGLTLGFLQAAEEAGVEPDTALVAGMEELFDKGVELFPENGAVLRFSYLTDDGIEGFQHDYGQALYLDGTKPLGILDHVGGNPAMVYACRLQNRETFVTFLEDACELAKKLGEQYADEDQNEALQEIFAFLDSFLDTTKEKLMPSTADGQIAALLDLGGAQGSEPIPGMQPDPVIPAIALLMGVNDRELFLESVTDYQEMFAVTSVFDEIDQLNVTESSLNGSKLFSIELEDVTDQTGLAPSLLVSDKFAGLVLGKVHAERVNTARPFEFAGGILDAKLPACAVFHYDNVQVIDAISGWGRFAVDLYNAFSEDGLDEDIVETAERALNFLKAFKGYSSITEIRNGRRITRYIYRFEDEK